MADQPPGYGTGCVSIGHTMVPPTHTLRFATSVAALAPVAYVETFAFSVDLLLAWELSRAQFALQSPRLAGRGLSVASTREARRSSPC